MVKKQSNTLFKWPDSFEALQESFPATPAPLPFHFAMITDTERVDSFRRSFKAFLKPTDRVLEIGAGSGVLSLLAEPYCREIVAVECDLAIAAYGKTFVREKSLGKIRYLCGDVRNYTHLGEFDAIICEVMDTAFISEAQIPITNFALKNFLKPEGRYFPAGAITFVELICKKFDIPGLGSFPLPHYEVNGKVSSKVFSIPELFQEITFEKKCPEEYEKTVCFSVQTSGMVNGIRFITNTLVSPGIEIHPTDWLNPYMVIPLDKTYWVKQGQELLVTISYQAGRGLEHVKTKVRC